MKHLIFGIALLAATNAILASDYDYSGLPDWENPYITSSNRLPARAVFVPASSMEEAIDIAYLRKPKTASKWVESLDGVWDFEWKARPDTNETKCAKIAVPGCWQLQGDYDPPIYTNARYPHVKNPPHIMEEPPRDFSSYIYRNPVGIYRRTFSVPQEWDGRRIILRFNGVYSAFYVRVNGVQIGYSEDSRLPAEFDITAHCSLKTANSIEVEVYRWCDGSYLEDQDFWRMSGIYRSVLLVAEKKEGLRDIIIEPTLSDDLKAGEVKVSCLGTRNAKVSLQGENGLSVQEPRLWDCDAPNLYTLVVEDDGDYFAFPVGFRKIAIEESVFKINNRRVLIKGVNRHEMSPTGGYTMTLDEMKKDIEVFKELNINAVRTCHYPDDIDWYTLCDINGIYVTCEANIESHGMGFGKESLAKREDFRHAHIERDTRMVETLRNHPSIIVWSQGNEAGYGENFAAAREAILALDSSRPVQYENRTYKKEDRLGTTDINCPMYRTPAQCEEFVANDPEMPLISCEYAHAMGNSTGGFADFWILSDYYDSFQGGYIWDFADQGLAAPSAHQRQLEFAGCGREDSKTTNSSLLTTNSLKYGGDFGDKPNDKNGHCNGIVDAWRRPHPGAYEASEVFSRFPNSYPTEGSVALDPLLANLEVKPAFTRARTDNDKGSRVKAFEPIMKVRRIPVDAETLRLAIELEVPTNTPYAHRVGVAFSLPANYTNLTWRGRGPHENYPDRKFSAKFGEWTKDISEMPPYIRPQDYGHYCDTESLTIGNLEVNCIFTSTPQEGLKDTFGFAVWPWTEEEISRANHNEELPPSSGVTLVVDAAMAGVGGDDSWSRIAQPREPHRPIPGRYRLLLELKAK